MLNDADNSKKNLWRQQKPWLTLRAKLSATEIPAFTVYSLY